MDYFCHPTSVVDAGATVGKNTHIWHFSHLSAGAVVGEDCSIGQGCFIADNAVLGRGVRLQNHVSVYSGVCLEDGVFVGPGAVFTNVRTPRAFVSRKDSFIPTTVKAGASIGGGAVILCGITVGRYALVGAGAVVTRSLPDYAVAVGNPARICARACRCGAVVRTLTLRRCPECQRELPPVDFTLDDTPHQRGDSPCAMR
jgi:UDP-2-acetamido-3-amino-2,3-dideoxy-glucuronate N-acetyltransferase